MSRPPEMPPRSAPTPPSKLLISTSRPTSSKKPMSLAIYGGRCTMLGGVTAPPKISFILSVGLVVGLVATGPGVIAPAAAGAEVAPVAGTADPAGLAAAGAVAAAAGAVVEAGGAVGGFAAGGVGAARPVVGGLVGATAILGAHAPRSSASGSASCSKCFIMRSSSCGASY